MTIPTSIFKPLESLKSFKPIIEPDMNHLVVKFVKSGFGSFRQLSQKWKRHLPHTDKYLVRFCRSGLLTLSFNLNPFFMQLNRNLRNSETFKFGNSNHIIIAMTLSKPKYLFVSAIYPRDLVVLEIKCT